MDQESEYRIEVASVPLSGTGLLSRVLFPDGRHHVFMRLRAGAGDGLYRTVSELHFTAKNPSGQYVPVSRKPLNVMANLAGSMGLEHSFCRAAEAMGLGGSIARLKGVQTGPHYDDARDHVQVQGHISGPQQKMMMVWNRACLAAVEINRANIPFTPIRMAGVDPANCRSGVRTILDVMRDEFRAIAGVLRHQKGRSLLSEIPSLGARLPRAEDISGLSPASLKRAQEMISRSLHETSRMLGSGSDSVAGSVADSGAHSGPDADSDRRQRDHRPAPPHLP